MGWEGQAKAGLQSVKHGCVETVGWRTLKRDLARSIEGPWEWAEPQRPARLSEIKVTCLERFTNINFTFFFF